MQITSTTICVATLYKPDNKRLGTRQRKYTKVFSKAWRLTIEIIDIECVLLSFFSKNFVSTKWRIYKGILASPRLLRREFRAVARSAIVFFFVKQSLQKDKNS